MRLKTSSGVRGARAITRILKSTKTVRPGYRFLTRVYTFDQASEPEYAFVTLILTCAMTIRISASVRATQSGSSDRYMPRNCFTGSTARSVIDGSTFVTR